MESQKVEIGEPWCSRLQKIRKNRAAISAADLALSAIFMFLGRFYSVSLLVQVAWWLAAFLVFFLSVFTAFRFERQSRSGMGASASNAEAEVRKK